MGTCKIRVEFINEECFQVSVKLSSSADQGTSVSYLSNSSDQGAILIVQFSRSESFLAFLIGPIQRSGSYVIGPIQPTKELCYWSNSAIQGAIVLVQISQSANYSCNIFLTITPKLR